ncbi:ABC transporter, substrate-binding protein, family 5 [Bifidobacterium dolichotidis]|uniref:ABC transporter, substrate-binding protein, family 5 n=1 Tax=Bifidobacterium dolichotidis TaxID=2306976 RepID=A0A430FRK2_9BIFI|nr:ABC transporter substrate-binding protein [Bifidobacterium dolichotidis]RSX55475.1 ABC transporter, substrate-binding protein, family 5 [Bifidobacterium dolichotidis]
MSKKEERTGWGRWALFAAILAIMALLFSIGFSMVRSSAPDTGVTAVESDSTFVIGLTDRPSSLDIRTNKETSVEQALLANVYESLVKRNNDNDVVPGIAKEWSISNDGLTYTFKLDSNARFASGRELNSSDVVWSLEQIVRNHWQGADALAQLQSVKNPDDQTVVIKLAEPNAALLRSLSGRAGIVYNPSESKLNYENEAAGSGPFFVASYNEDSIVLKRNTRYWAKPAQASQITLKYFDNESALVDAVNDDSVNMALPTRASSIEDAVNNPVFNVATGVSAQQVIVGFNNENKSILSDEQVRQAARYAIDTKTIAETMKDAYSALGGPIGPLEPGYEDLTDLFPHDVAKARQMLSFFPAGYVGTIDFLVPPRYEDLGKMATQNLQEAGFQVSMEVVDSGLLQSRIDNGDYDMAIMQLIGQYSYRQFTTPDSVFHYTNAHAQDEYKAALRSTNATDYDKHLAAFARVASEDAASAWLYTRKDFVISKARLSGYPTTMTATYLPLADLTR